MNRLVALLMAIPAFAIDFTSSVIATDLRGGYQVVVVDMNKDGKPDLLALSSGMPDLYWFENASWQRHTITGPFKRMINAAARDLDGNGVPELALASGFENLAKNSAGIVSILRNTGDGKWSATEIDRLTTSHRLRWADVGMPNPILVNAPLTGAKADAPMFEDQAPLVLYAPPDFKRQTINEANRGVVHGILIHDWNKDGRDDILTASFVGIHVQSYKNGKWTREEIAKGDPSAWPKSGSSDIAIGKLGRSRFLTAIEPWHGNQVVVYAGKKRAVIDDSLTDGHTILAADFDKDGRDEIVAGFRGGKRGVYLYREQRGSWQKQVLDEGSVAAAACAAADLDADGWTDLACIGSATQNLKVYRNVGSGKSN